MSVQRRKGMTTEPNRTPPTSRLAPLTRIRRQRSSCWQRYRAGAGHVARPAREAPSPPRSTRIRFAAGRHAFWGSGRRARPAMKGLVPDSTRAGRCPEPRPWTVDVYYAGARRPPALTRRRRRGEDARSRITVARPAQPGSRTALERSAGRRTAPVTPFNTGSTGPATIRSRPAPHARARALAAIAGNQRPGALGIYPEEYAAPPHAFWLRPRERPPLDPVMVRLSLQRMDQISCQGATGWESRPR